METNNNTQKVNQPQTAEFTQFPLTISTHWAFVDGEWTKFHIVYNTDGEPINATPMTKEDLKRVASDFLSLLETL